MSRRFEKWFSDYPGRVVEDIYHETHMGDAFDAGWQCAYDELQKVIQDAGIDQGRLSGEYTAGVDGRPVLTETFEIIEEGESNAEP